MTSEREKMIAGAPYRASDPELVEARLRAQEQLARYNATAPRAAAERDAVLRALFGAVGKVPTVMPRFSCDYGFNIRVGDNLFVNYDCVFLDCAPIDLGDDVQIGPSVQIYTATHPLDAALRRTGIEGARPVRIGHNVWVGGGAIVLPGVTVGDDAVIGAGSVVTRDVPPGADVVGNPAKVRG
jgi:maltose O-acetyltransferase